MVVHDANVKNIQLCDFYFLEKGPFNSFEMKLNRTCDWTGLKFSNDGKQILISTNGGMICILNAFTGDVMHKFTVSAFHACDENMQSLWIIVFYSNTCIVAHCKGYNNSRGLNLEACFTPDSQFVMIGKPFFFCFIVPAIFASIHPRLEHNSLSAPHDRLRGRESPCLEHRERDESRCAGWEASGTHQRCAV